MSSENSVQNSRELLEKVFSSIYGMVAYFDRDFNFIRVNRAYAAADGREPEYYVGKNHFALYPHAENEAIFRQVVESGEPYIAYAKPFEYPDAPERGISYWDWTLTPVHNDSGAVDGLLLSLHEVTDRVKAEQAHQQSEQGFRLLFDNAADAIFIHDLQGHFVEVNEVACRRLGYRREELLKMSVLDIDAPEMAARFGAVAKSLLDKGEMIIESLHVTRGGMRIPVEVNARVIAFRGESAVLSVARDISERLQSEKALRESEANIRAMVDASSESVMLLDRDGVLLTINDTGARRLGRAPEELSGHNVFDVIPPQLAEQRRQVLRQVVESGRPYTHEDVRDGRHLVSSIYPVVNEAGEVERVALYSRDVTETYRLQATDILLGEIDSQVLHADSFEQLMSLICRELVERLEYRLAWIGRKGAGGEVEVLSLFGSAREYGEELWRIGVRWDDTPQGNGPVGTAIRTGEVQRYRIDDIAFKPWREAAQRQGLAAILSVPLTIKGEVYGALALYSNRGDAFDSAEELARIDTIAKRLRIASENTLNQQRLRLLGAALEAAGSGVLITECDGRIVWVNKAFCLQSGYGEGELLGQTPRILKSGRQDSAFYAELWSTILAGRRWNAETVEQRKGGKLYTVSQTITPILDNSGEISHFIAIHEDISTQKAAQERIEYLAHYDGLTGLANRALFYDRLKHTIALTKRDKGYFALMFLDLDRFKPINDTYGHAVGDQLLREVARRVASVLRDSDTVARLGGDEFTVILPTVGNEREAFLVGNKISAAIAEPYLLEGNEVITSASIGVAIYPEHGESDAELITAADSAMYTAKEAGRHCIALASEQ